MLLSEVNVSPKSWEHIMLEVLHSKETFFNVLSCFLLHEAFLIFLFSDNTLIRTVQNTLYTLLLYNETGPNPDVSTMEINSWVPLDCPHVQLLHSNQRI